MFPLRAWGIWLAVQALAGGAPESEPRPAPVALGSIAAEEVAALDEDDSCAASGSCSLQLRQLRASSGGASLEAAGPAAVSSSPAAPPTEDEADEGMPGGWGEAADFADLLGATPNGTVAVGGGSDVAAGSGDVNLTLKAGRGHSHWQGQPSSCARMGCPQGFTAHARCQCNPSCHKYGNCCGDYSAVCQATSPQPPPPQPTPSPPWDPVSGQNVMTLYHQTGQEAGPLILANGFKPGNSGWCGAGIYFATNPQSTNTKAIGPDSHKGFMIEARVDVGRVKQMPRTCGRVTNDELRAEGYDSVRFDPGDGEEYVVYDKSKVLSMRRIDF